MKVHPENADSRPRRGGGHRERITAKRSATQDSPTNDGAIGGAP